MLPIDHGMSTNMLSIFPEAATSFHRDFALNTMLTAAEAAYDTMTKPVAELAMPAGFTLVALIQADPSKAAVAAAAAPARHQELARNVVTEGANFGFVAHQAETATWLVAFRGSKTIWDWVYDGETIPTPFLPDPSAGFVHLGFQLVYHHVRDSVVKLLRARRDECEQIWVTGHSLGGALAVLAASDILTSTGVKCAPGLYTFAGPRAVAPDFAKHFDGCIPECHRVVNFMDVVPQLPPPLVFEHVGRETEIHGGFEWLNVAHAHHIATYRTGLEQMKA